MKKVYFVTIFALACNFFSFSQLNIIDSLKQVFKGVKHDTIRCAILNQMIESETDDAVWPEFNDDLIRISESNLKKNCTGRLKKIYSNYLAIGYNNVGYLSANMGDFHKSLRAYFNCIKVQNGIQDFSEVAITFVSIGNLYKIQGQYSKAMEYYTKALNLSEVIKDRKGIANAFFYMGDVYDYQGNISASLECYLKSLKIREEMLDTAGTALCFNNIALLYEKQDEFDKALFCLEKSLTIYSKFDDVYSKASVLNNIGLCYLHKNELGKAEGYFNRSLIAYKDINDTRSKAFVYTNLGVIFQEQSEFEKALLFFDKSLEIRTELNDRSGVAHCLCSIAKIYFAQKKYKDAEKTAIKSITIAREIGYADEIQNVAIVLSQIYEKQNKGLEALSMHKLHIQMRDSLKSINSQKALITQNAKYEYDKKATADSVKVSEEKKVTNAQLKQEKTQRFALYGGIFLVGLFGVFMFSRFKVTKKQNELIQVQKAELQHQKELVEEHQKETLDSIHYAKRIQTALIANSDFITQHIPNNFIYFNPKDIVSGDFYWATKHNNKFYLAACDSTGHGVPGAFMSLLNMGFLSEAIKEKNIEEPNEIFNYVRERLIATISEGGQKDGMDGILICIDTSLSVRAESRTITYAAANNEPILIRNNEVIELPKDKMPVGKCEKTEKFSLHSLELKSGDALYLYTDGFADQFGGPKGKKFKYRQLNDLLLTIKDLPLSAQKDELECAFEKWRGTQEQVDDVLIIGIKI